MGSLSTAVELVGTAWLRIRATGVLPFSFRSAALMRVIDVVIASHVDYTSQRDICFGGWSAHRRAAHYGVGAIPSEWVSRLAPSEEIAGLADGLVGN